MSIFDHERRLHTAIDMPVFIFNQTTWYNVFLYFNTECHIPGYGKASQTFDGNLRAPGIDAVRFEYGPEILFLVESDWILAF